jgi:hypothetical protein
MTTQQADQTLIKSYRYLRLAMVGLVVCLTVAVIHQSVKQGTILSSISAYYFTHAQSIFVGALIAIGVCMIALRGTTDADDILLNIGGMLAPVVAVVPTARIKDHRKILSACRESDGATIADPSITGVDCPSELALQAITEANVANNVLALLAVAYVGLVATLLFARHDRMSFDRIRLGFGIAVAVVVVVTFVFFAFRDLFVHVAHYAAAIPMFSCIVLVVIINAVRRQKVEVTDTGLRARTGQAAAALLPPRNGYAVIALLMLVAVLVGGALEVAGTYEDTIFYLEAALILLFGIFWVLQTIELLDIDPCPPRPGPASDDVLTSTPADDGRARHPA